MGKSSSMPWKKYSYKEIRSGVVPLLCADASHVSEGRSACTVLL